MARKASAFTLETPVLTDEAPFIDATTVNKKFSLTALNTLFQANTASTDLTDTANIAYLNTANTYVGTVIQDFASNTLDNVGKINDNGTHADENDFINIEAGEGLGFTGNGGEKLKFFMSTQATPTFTYEAPKFNVNFKATAFQITYTINRAEVVSDGSILSQIDIRGQDDAAVSRVFSREKFFMRSDVAGAIVSDWQLLVGDGSGSVAQEVVIARGTNQIFDFADGWNIEIDDADIILSTGTGTKIATATTQKLAFWNATPVVQQAHIADATDAADVILRLNDLLAQMATLGLQAAS